MIGLRKILDQLDRVNHAIFRALQGLKGITLYVIYTLEPIYKANIDNMGETLQAAQCTWTYMVYNLEI